MSTKKTSLGQIHIFSLCLLVAASVSLGWYTEGNAADANGETTATAPSDRMTPFQRSLARYTALAAGLDADLAAYRASIPLFAKFSDVYNKEISPLVVKRLQAQMWLADAKKKGAQDQSNYNKQKANKAYISILATIYKDIYPKFHKALEEGRFTLDNEQDKKYFTYCHTAFKAGDNSLSKPFEQHYPYTDQNTIEYWSFIRDLGNTAYLATLPLQKMVKQVPPQLKEKERKVKQLHAEVFLSPGPPDRDSKYAADTQPDKKNSFQRSLARYTALVAELDADLAAYRASLPLFAKFSDVYIKDIIPLELKGMEADRWLREARKRGMRLSNYDDQKARKATMNILATIYKEIYPEFQKAMEAGWFTFSKEQGRIYFQQFDAIFLISDNSLSRPFEQHYPHQDKDTYEYWHFAHYFMMAAIPASVSVRGTVEQIPFQLKQRQDKLKQLHAQLARQAKQSGEKVALPDAYTEPYLKKLEDEEAKIKMFGRSRK
ncbi:MAG: hypothetical protein ACYTF1_19895 [Planctomycetota bacterium]|jgi:hypothetical protein